MPYKRLDSRYWQIAPVLRRFGRIGPYSTGTEDRKLADRMHNWLQELELHRPQLIEHLLAGTFTFRELWVARELGKLDELERFAEDPPLKDAVATVRGTVTDPRTLRGLDQVLEYAPRGARLSYLTEPRNIHQLHQRAREAGLKPNSIIRSLQQGMIQTLRYFYGRDHQQQILRQAPLRPEDDTRRILVTAEQIGYLIATAQRSEPAFGAFLGLAILTAVDRSPLLSLRAKHFNAEAQTLAVPDWKTESRARVLVVPDSAGTILRELCEGKGPEDRLFPWTPGEVRHRWETVRDQAGGIPSRNAFQRGKRAQAMRAREELRGPNGRVVSLARLRLKDLRHVLPTYWSGLGFSERDLQSYLGHSRLETTARYIAERPMGDRERLNQVAEAMGWSAAHPVVIVHA